MSDAATRPHRDLGPTVSVVIPATDAPPTLDKCLQALRSGVDRPDETIVVSEPAALSAAAARNEGVRRATGDVILFVDADVEVHPDAVQLVRSAFEAAPDLSALFGSYDDEPAVLTTVSAFRNLLHHHVHHSGPGPAETFWTGLGAIRRAAFWQVGGFDEARYRKPSIEDIDLGSRLSAAGARIVLDPSVQGKHLKEWTLRSMLWTDVVHRGIPWVELQVRNRRLSGALNLGWRHRLSALASVGTVASVALGRVVGVVAGLALLVVLNHDFYDLLRRRLGNVNAIVGMGLHGLHHLAAVLALVLGLPLAAFKTLVVRSRRSVPGVAR